jgi:Bacterial SH3 domain
LVAQLSQERGVMGRGRIKPTDVSEPEDPKSLESRLRVVVEALNVRRTPSLGGHIVGQLQKEDIVEGKDVSPDGAWQQVRHGELVGWAARRYLVPYASETPPSALNEIFQIASTSAIATYNWKNRGVAPLGYIKGMAMVFARVYCRLKEGDLAALAMSKANTGNRQKDALAWYAQQFREAGMDNETAGPSTLRHLFVLLIGLGMRESSGNIARVETERRAIRVRLWPKPACFKPASMRQVRILS